MDRCPPIGQHEWQTNMNPVIIGRIIAIGHDMAESIANNWGYLDAISFGSGFGVTGFGSMDIDWPAKHR